MKTWQKVVGREESVDNSISLVLFTQCKTQSFLAFTGECSAPVVSLFLLSQEFIRWD